MLRNVVQQRIDSTVYNTVTSVMAEVSGDPVMLSDGSYEVSVELPGGAYGGLSRLRVIHTDDMSGVAVKSIRKGDVVLISFDEKGEFAPRITSVLSREAAAKNMAARYRTAMSDAQRAEQTAVMSIGR